MSRQTQMVHYSAHGLPERFDESENEANQMLLPPQSHLHIDPCSATC